MADNDKASGHVRRSTGGLHWYVGLGAVVLLALAARPAGASSLYELTLSVSTDGAVLSSPTNLRVEEARGSMLSLAWEPPAGADVEAYRLYVSMDNQTYGLLAVLAGSSSSVTLDQMLPNETYFFFLKAVSGSDESAASNLAVRGGAVQAPATARTTAPPASGASAGPPPAGSAIVPQGQTPPAGAGTLQRGIEAPPLPGPLGGFAPPFPGGAFGFPYGGGAFGFPYGGVGVPYGGFGFPFGGSGLFGSPLYNDPFFSYCGVSLLSCGGFNSLATLAILNNLLNTGSTGTAGGGMNAGQEMMQEMMMGSGMGSGGSAGASRVRVSSLGAGPGGLGIGGRPRGR